MSDDTDHNKTMRMSNAPESILGRARIIVKHWTKAGIEVGVILGAVLWITRDAAAAALILATVALLDTRLNSELGGGWDDE